MIKGFSYFLYALMLLVLPLNWIIAASMAAFFHEAGHIIAAWILNGKIVSVHISASGAVIHTAEMNKWAALIATMAGSAVSLLLFCFYPLFSRFAVCALIQGLYNLIPVYPLDGGRAADILGELLFGVRYYEYRTFFQRTVAIGISAGFLLAALILKIPALILPVIPLMKEKYLANSREKGYNKATIEMR